MRDELFDVVDLRDQVVERKTRAEVHAKRLLHRAVHVMLKAENGKWILQKRAESKDLDPSLWTSSCSGHLDAGEDYLKGAIRECREELGIFARTEQLREILRLSPCRETGNEFVRVYLLETDLLPSANPEEIEALQSLELQDISRRIEKFPETFSLSFRHLFSLSKKIMSRFT